MGWPKHDMATCIPVSPHRKELPTEAAKREVKEEVGIEILNPIYLGEYLSTRQYKRDTVYCFYTSVKESFFKIDNQEIEEAQWFLKSNIPNPHSFAVDEILRIVEKSQN